jgi:hypothetical protein
MLTAEEIMGQSPAQHMSNEEYNKKVRTAYLAKLRQDAERLYKENLIDFSDFNGIEYRIFKLIRKEGLSISDYEYYKCAY